MTVLWFGQLLLCGTNPNPKGSFMAEHLSLYGQDQQTRGHLFILHTIERGYIHVSIYMIMIFHCQGSTEPDPGTTVNTHIPVNCAPFLQLILNTDSCGSFTAYCSPLAHQQLFAVLTSRDHLSGTDVLWHTHMHIQSPVRK